MNKKALTMTEMMIATAVFVIISTVLFIVLIAGRRSWDVGYTYLTLQQQARTAVTAITNELGESAPTVAERFDCNSDCVGHYIEFQVPVVDNNFPLQDSVYQDDGTIKWGADGVKDNKILFAAVTDSFSAEYGGKLLRLSETTGPSAPYCGDGECNGTETCVTCEEDCGPCDPPPCFLAGTPILLADGSIKMIEDIKVGDMVLAFDEENKKTVPDKVKKFMVNKTDKYLLVNNHLKVTANHTVYSDGEYVAIGQLQVGDTLLNKDGQPEKISSIQEIQQEAVVYDLEVNPYHNYFAGGYLVHNKPADQQEMGWSFLDRFKFLGLAFAEGPGDLGDPGDYGIKVVSDDISQLDIDRLPVSGNPETIIITIHAQRNTLGGMPVEVVISSQITLKN